jgi:hypothetical protein
MFRPVTEYDELGCTVLLKKRIILGRGSPLQRLNTIVKLEFIIPKMEYYRGNKIMFM